MNYSENFYYLLGAYWGDGHVYYSKLKRGSSHQFTIVSEDEDFCQICSQIVYDHVGKYGTIKLIENYYKLVVCSKDLCVSILSHTCSVENYYLADKYQKKLRLPIFPGLEYKKSFIRGLMDSDGWISRRKNGKYIKYEIGFKNTSVLSPAIYDLMIKFGLSCNKLDYREGVISHRKGKQYNKSKAQWCWTITPRNYITMVGFSIARKQSLCQRFLEERKKD